MVCKLHLYKAATKRKVCDAPEKQNKTKQQALESDSVVTLNTFLNLYVLILCKMGIIKASTSQRQCIDEVRKSIIV